MREKVTTALDLAGALGLAVAAGLLAGMAAGIAVISLAALTASWRVSQ